MGMGTNIRPLAALYHLLSLAPVNPDRFYLPGFTFLVPAHSGIPDKIKEGRKTVVCVFVCVCVQIYTSNKKA